MIKINPYSTNSYKNQNFQANNKSNNIQTYASDKKFGYADAAIIGGGAWLGSALGFAQYRLKASKFKKASELIDNFLDTLLPDFIYREKLGKSSDIPNCIMVTGKDDKYHNEVIKWIADNCDCRYVETDYKKNILEQLEHQQATYKVPGKDYTLMHVKNMERMINPQIASFSCIESMKDIMSATEVDYHTTLIFSTEHPEKLDKIALQPHRVREAVLTVDRDTFFDCDKWLRKSSFKKNVLIGAAVGLLAGTITVLIKNKNNLFKNKEKEV